MFYLYGNKEIYSAIQRAAVIGPATFAMGQNVAANIIGRVVDIAPEMTQELLIFLGISYIFHKSAENDKFYKTNCIYRDDYSRSLDCKMSYSFLKSTENLIDAVNQLNDLYERGVDFLFDKRAEHEEFYNNNCINNFKSSSFLNCEASAAYLGLTKPLDIIQDYL